MKMFRKQKASEDSTSVVRKVTALEMIVRRSLVKFALYLQTKTEKLPRTFLKILLVLFCLTWSVVSIYFMISAFTSFDKKTPQIIIEKIHSPNYYPGTEGVKLRAGSFSVNKSFSRVQSFKNYMDSLNGTDKGKLIYDSILLTRPQLLDSIRLLDLLQSQQK